MVFLTSLKCPYDPILYFISSLEYSQKYFFTPTELRVIFEDFNIVKAHCITYFVRPNDFFTKYIHIVIDPLWNGQRKPRFSHDPCRFDLDLGLDIFHTHWFLHRRWFRSLLISPSDYFKQVLKKYCQLDFARAFVHQIVVLLRYSLIITDFCYEITRKLMCLLIDIINVNVLQSVARW